MAASAIIRTSMYFNLRRFGIGLAAVFMAVSVLAVVGTVYAANDDQQFSIQVAPSPLVATLEPGESKSLELKVRNAGNATEQLKAEFQAFKVSDSGEVQMLNDQPKEIQGWISFSDPKFTVRAGEWFTEHLRINTPKDAGFSYSFAIVISRADPVGPKPGQEAFQGSVAVFALLSIDRPGATRAFSVEQFGSDKRVYQYLPSNFTFKLKNTGNTIVQPQGNIFIQRTSSSAKPISILSLNEKGSYILPGTSRTLTASWSDGFPSYQLQKSADNVDPKNKLVWDWGKAQHFRFGHYVARMIAIYNDGQRDVPIEAEVGFWVIPWKLILGLVVVLIIIIVGLTVIIRKLVKLSRYARGYHHRDQ
jgi:archaellum component FlaF (FlaF/FlaG flagellin family)